VYGVIMLNIYEQVDRNKQKSAIIIIGFIVFIFVVAYCMSYAFNGDGSLLGWALILSGIMSFTSYYYADRMILSISNAKPATKKDYFDYYTVTENLCMAAQLPMPQLYVIEDTAMNAFATGRDPQHAVVCATTGILARLNRTELEGVIAHELSHVKNYDIRLMSIVTVLVGVVTLIADWFLRASMWGNNRRDRDDNNQFAGIMMIIGLISMIISPLIAQLIQLSISRNREFLADASAVAITKYPDGLAKALEKISKDKEPLELANKATAHLYISNPLSNQKGTIAWFSNLFSTHPPIEERIAALKAMR
jgi:heat shock protein HtpX